MEADLIGRAEEAIRRFGLLSGGECVLVGVSGGQDSVALFDVLAQLAPSMELRLAIAHLHHGLRGAHADQDQALAERLARSAGVPCRCRRIDVQAMAQASGKSFEEAGRQARYEFFEAVRRELEADVIAVGHTASDRAETLIMNLLRGAGLDGLGSIPPKRGPIVRPLITATRQETQEHCRRRELEYRTDRTNLEPEHLRNRVRLELLPLLEREYVPGAIAHITRAAELAHEEVQVLRDIAADALEEVTVESTPGRIVLQLAGLDAMPEALTQRVVREAVRVASGDVRDLRYNHVRDLVCLIKWGRTGAHLVLPSDVSVERGYEELTITQSGAEGAEPGRVSASLAVPGEVALPTLGVHVRAELRDAEGKVVAKDKCTATVDATEAGQALVVRNSRPGDRFRPLGLGGEKKLQDFLVDSKVPRAERSRVPIVVRRDGQIVWVVGHQLDERAKVSPSTSHIIVLTASAL